MFGSLFGSAQAPKQENEMREIQMTQMQAFVRQNIFPAEKETRAYVLRNALNLFRRQIRRQPADNTKERRAIALVLLDTISSQIDPNLVRLVQFYLDEPQLGKDKILEYISPDALRYYNANSDLVSRCAFGQYLTGQSKTKYEGAIYAYSNVIVENKFITEFLMPQYWAHGLPFHFKENLGVRILEQLLSSIAGPRGKTISWNTSDNFYLFESSLAIKLRELAKLFQTGQLENSLRPKREAWAKTYCIGNESMDSAESKIFDKLKDNIKENTIKQLFYPNTKLDPNSIHAPLNNNTISAIIKGKLNPKIEMIEATGVKSYTFTELQPENITIYKNAKDPLAFMIIKKNCPFYYYNNSNYLSTFTKESMIVFHKKYTRGEDISHIKDVYRLNFFLDLFDRICNALEIYNLFADDLDHFINNLYF